MISVRAYLTCDTCNASTHNATNVDEAIDWAEAHGWVLDGTCHYCSGCAPLDTGGGLRGRLATGGKNNG